MPTDNKSAQMLGDASIYQSCRLKTLIKNGKWPGAEVPPLMVGEVADRPYLKGDCTFTLYASVIKINTMAQQRSFVSSRCENVMRRIPESRFSAPLQYLRTFFCCCDEVYPFKAIDTQWIIYSAGNFGFSMHHEDVIFCCITVFVIFLSLCIKRWYDSHY